MSFAAAEILSKPNMVLFKNNSNCLCYSDELIFYPMIIHLLSYIKHAVYLQYRSLKYQCVLFNCHDKGRPPLSSCQTVVLPKTIAYTYGFHIFTLFPSWFLRLLLFPSFIRSHSILAFCVPTERPTYFTGYRCFCLCFLISSDISRPDYSGFTDSDLIQL